jgi:ABC-type nitrate/sulfonate/bicarbonate transport system permease component
MGGTISSIMRLLLIFTLLAALEFAVKTLHMPAYILPAPSNISYALAS